VAGFREFQTGEVLTAGNVNDYLMQQAVMKFADASARDTALGTAVGGDNALREGMVAWLDSTDEVLTYDGTSWSALRNAGIGTNAVSTLSNTVFTTTSTSFSDVTDLTVTITPSSATSKVLVVGFIAIAEGGGGQAIAVLARGGTAIAGQGTGGIASATTANTNTSGLAVIDSPATTSATVYSFRVAASGAGVTAYVNRNSTGATPTFSSSITAIEVAA